MKTYNFGTSVIAKYKNIAEITNNLKKEMNENVFCKQENIDDDHDCRTPQGQACQGCMKLYA